MPRKIKKKPEPKPSNEGKIILIVTGILLAVIAVFLIILAIVQNVGKKMKIPISVKPVRQSVRFRRQQAAPIPAHRVRWKDPLRLIWILSHLT